MCQTSNTGSSHFPSRESEFPTPDPQMADPHCKPSAHSCACVERKSCFNFYSVGHSIDNCSTTVISPMQQGSAALVGPSPQGSSSTNESGEHTHTGTAVVLLCLRNVCPGVPSRGCGSINVFLCIGEGWKSAVPKGCPKAC